MSWILGCFAQAISENVEDRLVSLVPPPLLKTRTANLILVAGGIPETLHSSAGGSEDNASDDGWVVAGSGMRANRETLEFLTTSAWERILNTTETFDSQSLDGHFVLCRWSGKQIELFSDQLGQRTLFVAETDGGVFFSTRLDWVCRLAGRATLDFGQLGSRWLCFNSMTPETGVVGVKQLGPGGGCTIGPKGLVFESRPWLPQAFRGSTEQDFLTCLQRFSNPALLSGRTISLGLSGGLDSRTLLSILSSGKKPVNLYVFGEQNDPDVSIAMEIGKRLGIGLTLYNDPAPSTSGSLALVQEYASQANLCEPGSSAVRQRYFSRIHECNALMMDGGFGELSRRQYLNRLLIRGKDALLHGDSKGILHFLRVVRVSFFSPDVIAEMERGAEAQLVLALSEMPNISEIGVENFLDLFTLRTRIPFWGCHEQTRLDGLVQNYMPFVQPSLLKTMFGLDIRVRSSGKMFRRIIRTLKPELAGFPLVKSNGTYPFFLGPVGSWVWTKAKSKLRKDYSSNIRFEVLYQLKEIALDLLHSQEVASDGALDSNRLREVVGGFYNGQGQYINEVDWWLTFHLWRRGLKE